MNKQIRLLLEDLFDDLYDIEDQKNLDTEFSDKIFKSKEDLRKEIKEQLKIQGPSADLNELNTRYVYDMSHLFEDLNIKNIKIDKWDVSNVKDMSYMFNNCEFFDGDLSKWDVSNVENMSYMFANCYNFNGNLFILFGKSVVSILLKLPLA